MTTCYYPDGSSTAPDDTPCDSTAEYSACCGSGSTCMANGLCLKDGLLSRGSCTDSAWDSDACPTQCQQYNTDAGAPITLCDRASSGNSNWTCGSLSCSNQAVLFTIPSANFTPLVAEQANATCDGTTTTGSSSSSSNGGGGFSSGQMAGVGAGIGVPLLLALLAVLWMLLAERRKTRNMMVGGATWGAPNGGQAGMQFEAMRQHQPAVELDAARERQELPVYDPKRT